MTDHNPSYEAAEQMRPCSANEVFHLTRKACVGAGLAHDRADDLAEAATLLQCTGFGGLAAVHALLARYQQTDAPLALGLTIDTDRLQVDRLRPEAEGVAVIDWLVAGTPGCQADVQMVCDPLLMAGLLLGAARRYGGCFMLQGADGHPAGYSLSGPDDIAGLPAHDRGWCVRYLPGDMNDTPVAYHHTSVEQQVWAALSELAHRTYVPASAASRQSGAGAGLVDND